MHNLWDYVALAILEREDRMEQRLYNRPTLYIAYTGLDRRWNY